MVASGSGCASGDRYERGRCRGDRDRCRQGDRGRRCRRRAHGAADPGAPCRSARRGGALRSEEHTSELQSHVNLVCRLLLEKKKKKNRYLSYSKKKKKKNH